MANGVSLWLENGKGTKPFSQQIRPKIGHIVRRFINSKSKFQSRRREN